MTLNYDLVGYLQEQGYSHFYTKGPSKLCAILHFTFTWGLMVNVDVYGCERRYCFHSEKEALFALIEWDGITEHPPGNWIKCKGSGCGDIRNPNYKEKIAS